MAIMADLTTTEIKAICCVLAHFLEGGWTEMLESLEEEQSEELFETVQSGYGKLSRLSRGKAA